jgi:hypothetical protein
LLAAVSLPLHHPQVQQHQQRDQQEQPKAMWSKK